MTEYTLEQLRHSGISSDVLPTELSRRTWGWSQFFTVWMGSIHNIPNYLVIGGLFALGIGVIQMFFAIMCAAGILAIVLALNGHIGAKYGIPFSIALVAIFGKKGATLIGILRGIIAGVMWFGLQTFAGSQALIIIIQTYFPNFITIAEGTTILGLSIPYWIAFLLFWFIHVIFFYGGMETIGKFTNYLAPLVYIVFIGMAIWSVKLAGGVSAIINYTTYDESPLSIYLFLVAICAIITSWAAPIVSVADFTRLAVSNKIQIIAQTAGLLLTYGLFAIASISIIIGSEIAFGTPIWNVLEVIELFDQRFAIVLAVLTLCLTTLSVNIVGNIVPAAMQVTALFPRIFRFQTGALVIAIAGICILPWRLMENETSIFGFLSIIGGILGPVAGVMLTKYYFIYKRTIEIESLYTNENLPTDKSAMFAVLFATILSLSSKFIPLLYPLYDIAWLTGLILSSLIYLLFQIIKRKYLTY